MAEAGTIRVKLKAVTGQFNAGMREAGKNLGGLSGKLSAIAGPAAAAGVAIAGIAVAVTKSVGKFAEFEAAIDRVGAITGLDTGSKQLEDMGKLARDLGATTKFTAVQVGEAYNFMAMAGMDANTIMEATPSVLQLAAAGALGLGDAANIVTNIMAGFGQEASELGRTNDILTAAITGANVDVQQLGESFKIVGPVAKAAGVSFSETTAAIAMLGSVGIQGSLAGTTLRGALANLLSPTKKAADIMKQLGVNAKDSQGKLLPFGDILKQFEKSGIDAGEAMEVFGLRAGPGMIALLGEGSAAFDEFNQKLLDSDGLTQSIADRGMSTLQGKTLALTSAFDGLELTIGKKFKPAAEVVVSSLSSMTNAIDEYISKSNGWVGLVKEITKDLIRLLSPLGAIEGLVLSIMGLAKGGTGSKRYRMDLEAAAGSAKDTDKAIQNLMRPATTGKISKGVKEAIEDGAKKAKPEIDFSGMVIQLTDAMMEAADKGLKDFRSGRGALVASAAKNFKPTGPSGNAIMTSTTGSEAEEAQEDLNKAKKDEAEASKKVTQQLIQAFEPALGKMSGVVSAMASGDATGAALAFVGAIVESSEVLSKFGEMFNEIFEVLGELVDVILEIIPIGAIMDGINAGLRWMSNGLGKIGDSANRWWKSLVGATQATDEYTRAQERFLKTVEDAVKAVEEKVADMKLDAILERTLKSGDFSGLSAEQKALLQKSSGKILSDLDEQIAMIDWGIIEGDTGALRAQRDKIQAAVDSIADPLEEGGKGLEDTVSKMNEATSGVPSGVKVAFARFKAAEAFTPGSSMSPAVSTATNVGGAPGADGGGGQTINTENIIIATDDPDEMFRKLENKFNTESRSKQGALSRVNQSSLNAFGMR